MAYKLQWDASITVTADLIRAIGAAIEPVMVKQPYDNLQCIIAEHAGTEYACICMDGQLVEIYRAEWTEIVATGGPLKGQKLMIPFKMKLSE